MEYRNNLPPWIKIEKVSNTKYQELLETQLDRGEASAITLAMEIGDTLLLLDDLKARKLSAKLGLKYTGTLGVINKAKEIGVVKSVKPLIDALLKTNFRISQSIITEFLRINNEIQDI